MKEAYRHDYDGNCAPGMVEYFNGATFSVGCFQWIPKENGKGLKKSAVIFRVKGYSSNPNLVYDTAKNICKKLDEGWVPDKKSIMVYKPLPQSGKGEDFPPPPHTT